MITVKRLKEILANLPDEARVNAYEGERTGLAIRLGRAFWWIDAYEDRTEDTRTEGFREP